MEANRFHGTRCISCGELFSDGDDIVVCPECGTPYHRECYQKEGSCINIALHESGQSWQPVTEDAPEADAGDSSGKIRCMRCGEENEPDTLMCVKCGLPLHLDNHTERPFNDNYKPGQGRTVPQGDNEGQGGFNGSGMPFPGAITLDKNSEIDGIKIEEYACYIKSNPLYFIQNFFRFFKLKTKVSFNFGALFFPEVYMLYRKMYKWGILMLIVTFLLSIPSFMYYGTQDVMGYRFIKNASFVDDRTFEIIARATNYALWGIKLLLGFLSNYLYYNSVRKNIRRIKEENPDDTQAKQIMALSGGVSWPAVIMGYTAMFAMFTGLMLIVNSILK